MIGIHVIVSVMKHQRRGKVIDLLDRRAWVERVFLQRPCRVEGCIIALIRKLAFELGPFGITINAIAPA